MTTTLNLSQDIRSLTDFKRHTTELTEQLRTSGRPLVLTVNGKAEFVVQDAASYQAMTEALERAATIEGIRRGLEQSARGEGRPASEFFAEFRARHGIHPLDGSEAKDNEATNTSVGSDTE
ncbi:MAG TPA: type II toxin-antitoxin system Phd/YefM family antitoxin [Abditibacterium sp.]|jgi:prevent-host-death family protein